MQYGKFEVQLNGEMINTVVRDGISPAEAEILRSIHGEHALTPIEITSEKPVNVEDEVDRLARRFRSQNAVKHFRQLYPGTRPRLPVRFDEIGFPNMPRAEEKVLEELAKKSAMTKEQAEAVIAATQKAAAAEEEKAEELATAIREEAEAEDEPEATPAPTKAAKKTAKKKPAAKKKTPMKDKGKDKFAQATHIEYD